MRAALLILACFAPAAPAAEIVLSPAMHHFRVPGEPEWAEFPEPTEAPRLDLSFEGTAHPGEQTLRLRQQNVKQTWKVLLNGRELGRLPRDENDMVVYFPVAPGTLVEGTNRLVVEQTGTEPDDVRLGEVAVDARPVADVLSQSAVEVRVTDADARRLSPCRITVLNAAGALQTVGAESNGHLAVRPGVIYSGNGRASFGLPAGEYTIHAGRGFEFGVDSLTVSLSAGQKEVVELSIRREVLTGGYVACDTHVHTLTHSGHGDATIQERMLTIAGEGIELPIAADHNVQIDYEPTAREMGVREYFTPVPGNEVTTKIGHFNVFPVQPGGPVPDHRLESWETIFESIYATPDVQAVILNHPRDIHSRFRPFGPEHHNALTAENLDGWVLRANAMELINSGAQQSDPFRLYHDWFGLLNRGLSITPVGSSDSHDVARHFVGQARTYIRCDDRDPGRIDTSAAVRSFVEGRVLVSCGLLADMKVDGRYEPGDLARLEGAEVTVSVRVLGPGWTTADRVELYANGRKIREEEIADGSRPGVKWSGEWKLPRPRHDLFLVAIASGPGVRDLYWPIARPYQPTSTEWEPKVIGSTGAVWLDGDGDQARTSAGDYARRLVEQHGNSLPELLRHLEPFDEAVAAQAAGLLQTRGIDLLSEETREQWRSAGDAVRTGFSEYVAAWRETEIARLGTP